MRQHTHCNLRVRERGRENRANAGNGSRGVGGWKGGFSTFPSKYLPVKLFHCINFPYVTVVVWCGVFPV